MHPEDAFGQSYHPWMLGHPGAPVRSGARLAEDVEESTVWRIDPRRGGDAWGVRANGMLDGGRALLGDQGLASSTKLTGVSAARRNRVNPAPVATSRSLASPACAPSARAPSWSSAFGVQSSVEAP